MAVQKLHGDITVTGKIAATAGTASGELATKGQVDAAEAAAKLRSAHTGTQLASTISDFTTAVDARVQAIVGAAPAALDTLDELAAALGDDANFAATMTTQLGALDTRIDTLEAGSGGSGASYKLTFGNGTNTSFTLTHNLATLDVMIEVVEVATGQTVYPVVSRPTVNTVLIDYNGAVPASNSQRALIRTI